MTDVHSTSPPPPPPPPGTEKKKGFGVLGWLVVGCLGLILIGSILTFACTAIVAKKAKNMVDEASANPAMSAAEMVVRLNPNLELVEKDEEAGTLTIYDKQKDQNVTLDLDDVMSGKFGVETEDGETMNFEIGQGEDGTFGATVTDEAGEVSKVSIGAEGIRVGSDAGELPAWLPKYKDAQISSPLSISNEGKSSGTAVFKTADSVSEVADALTSDLESRGFEVERTSYEAAGVTSIMLSCKGPEDEEISVSINSTGDGSAVAMNYSGKP